MSAGSRVLIANPVPYVDCVMVMGSIAVGTPQYAQQTIVSAGGKGLNLARALARLGVRAETYGIAGGRVGELLRHLANDEGLAFHAADVRGETSAACILVQPGGTASLLANGRPASVSLSDWDDYIATISTALARSPEAILVCTGPLPGGVPASGYNALLEVGHSLSLHTIVDADGAVLAAALRGRPDLVKVNAAEANEVMTPGRRADADDPVSIASTIDALLTAGAQRAIVTLGSRGAVAAGDGERRRARAAATALVSDVGAGDAFLAGVIASLRNGDDFWEAVLMGLAVGSASTETLQPGDFVPERAASLRSGRSLAPLQA